MIKFFKYQGTGNDFILIDDRELVFPVKKEIMAALCHRRFGIGADGLILLQLADGYDFRMVYFNADGGEGSMCGNGGRCVVKFAHDLGLFASETSFIAVDGAHDASVNGDQIRLKMSPVADIYHEEQYDFMNTGSPHYVTYVADLKATDVVEEGRSVRYGDKFGPLGGTNVNFIEILTPNNLRVRTYERGVEDETYSCGTGVTACALSAHLKEGWASPIAVETEGGNLQVEFQPLANEQFDEIYLIGPAKRVFTGEVAI